MSTDEASASKSVILMPKGEHKYTLIFLHGTSEKGQEYVKYFGSQPENRITPLNMKIVMPTAPVRETGPDDKKTTAWFDIKSPILAEGEEAKENTIQSKVDQEKLEFSAEYILFMIDKEAKLLGNEPGRVFVGGFGSGGAVALAAFLKF